MKHSLRQGYDKHMALLVFHTQAGFQAYAQLQRLHLWTKKFQCIRSWVRPFASMGNLYLAKS
jgi:hypothetical protein